MTGPLTWAGVDVLREPEPSRAARALGVLGLVLGLGAAPAGAQVATDREAAEAGPPTGITIKLTRKEFVRQVLFANSDVQAQRISAQIAEEGVKRAGSIYEPEGTLSLTHNDNRRERPNEPESRRILDERTTRAETGVNVLTPTGATVKGTVGVNALISNLGSQGRQYESSYRIELTQPLARGAGVEATNAGIRAAERKAAAERKRQAEVAASVASDAASAYNELAAAQAVLANWQDSVETARRTLLEARRLHRAGRLNQTDVLAVENELLRAQSEEAAARQRLARRRNRVFALMELKQHPRQQVKVIAVDGLPKVTEKSVDYDVDLQEAFANRPDYQAQLEAVQRRDIRVAQARNDRLPKVDLVASYEVGNLAPEAREAVTDFDRAGDFPSWSVGVEVEVPLGGSREATADLRRRKLQAHRAEIERRNLENEIARDVSNSLNAVKRTRERWRKARAVRESEALRLSRQQDLLAKGRADRQRVLQRREALIRARNQVVRERGAVANAWISLYLAKGVILEELGLERMKTAVEGAP